MCGRVVAVFLHACFVQIHKLVHGPAQPALHALVMTRLLNVSVKKSKHFILHGSGAMVTEAQVQEVVVALQTLRADNPGLTQQLIDLQKSVAGSQGGGRQGDAAEKLLKRTEMFDGNNFQDWKFRVETNMRAVLLDGAAILKQTEHASRDIAEKGLTDSHLNVNVDKTSFYFMAAACKSGVFDIVRNVPGGLGAEAWRRLCRRFGAKTGGNKVVLLRRRANPPKVKQLAEAPGLIENWKVTSNVSPQTSKRVFPMESSVVSCWK